MDLTDKDRKGIKKAIELRHIDYGTDIIAYAWSNIEKNRDLLISIMDGEPLQENVYDTVRDCYIVEGIDWMYAGSIPFGCRLEIKGIDDWSADIPLPLNLVRRFLTKEQNSTLNAWIKSHKDCSIHYLQFRRCY